MFLVNLLNFQIVHRTLAAMLGSLAALAALAVIGDVSLFYSSDDTLQHGWRVKYSSQSTHSTVLTHLHKSLDKIGQRVNSGVRQGVRTEIRKDG